MEASDFKIGQRVTMTDEARTMFRHPVHDGRVVGLSRDGRLLRVIRDGLKGPDTWDPSFWRPADPPPPLEQSPTGDK